MARHELPAWAALRSTHRVKKNKADLRTQNARTGEYNGQSNLLNMTFIVQLNFSQYSIPVGKDCSVAAAKCIATRLCFGMKSAGLMHSKHCLDMTKGLVPSMHIFVLPVYCYFGGTQ